MSCETYRELLPAYLDDSLDEVRRTGFRAHLRACDECRGFAVAEEPTLVLSLAAAREPSAERIEVCVSAVVAGVRQERLQQRLRPSRRPWLAAVAAVVLALTASTVWWMNGAGSDEALPIQAEVTDVEILDTTDGEDGPAVIDPPPRVEIDMTHEEVRVYQYAIGDDADTGAVFIVNPAMEL